MGLCSDTEFHTTIEIFILATAKYNEMVDHRTIAFMSMGGHIACKIK